MSLLDNIRKFGRAFLTDDKPRGTPIAKTSITKSLRQQVWEAPALFNRHTRRAAGLLSKLWRWDLNSTAEMQRVFNPRYIRRHFKADTRIDGPDGLPVDIYGTFTHPKTRRQRRHRARILAISKTHGL